MNVQGDRLSNLPDDLIHKILSLVGTKLAVQTSALSPRWRYLWTTLPCLNFSRENFKTLPKFSNFVTHVLSWPNNQTEISSAKLSFRGKASQVFVKRILNCAFSHNVKQLTVSCLPDKSEIEFPLSLFSSQSLEHLTLTGFLNLSSLLAPLTELISYQPSPFVKLKSLKVYPEVYYVKVLQTIPAEVKKYLLDGSPSATFTEVSYEEMRASENAKSALSCMAELGEMLEHEKANIETNMDRIEHGKAKTSAIISMLCDIEELVTELPASKRAQFEASFSRTDNCWNLLGQTRKKESMWGDDLGSALEALGGSNAGNGLIGRLCPGVTTPHIALATRIVDANVRLDVARAVAVGRWLPVEEELLAKPLPWPFSEIINVGKRSGVGVGVMLMWHPKNGVTVLRHLRLLELKPSNPLPEFLALL
ncbi:F-box domain containing protein [Tanacetum coccineum]|uniref:F-box domain containing protein n=1 Tax=Tanacetum coccineum TaxID=301880 RepID=A0ABQ5B4P1_9ASTR